MSKMRCPHNAGSRCCPDLTPINIDDENTVTCDLGECLYLFELNRMRDIRDNTDNLESRLQSIEQSLRLYWDDGSEWTIAQVVNWIRINLGSIDDDDSSIAQKLDNLYKRLDTVDDHVAAIEDNTNNI